VKVLLSGVVGSTAYGLAHEGSDIDRLGVFAARTRAFHGLSKPQESIVETDPDITVHEAGKFCRLALNGNPTVMELLWLEGYETLTPLGQELIDIRSAFLSATRVRNAYLGYATQQLTRLEDLSDVHLSSRKAKHARHMYRLLMQGLCLWTRGELPIKLENPDVVFSFGSRVALGDLNHARLLLLQFEHTFNSVPTVLPDRPDERVVEEWLHRVRDEFYERKETR
jgi:predicted nucleotidyltransferase